MQDTLLISWTKVKQYSDINDSLDPDLIKNNIRIAQDIQLQRIIGTILYNKICDLVKNNTISDSENANYKTLLDDYIQDMLLYASYYELLESVFIRPKNNGLLTPTGGENSESVDRNRYEMKRTSVLNKFMYYADRLSKYLVEEQNDFPELTENTLLYQQIPDYGSQYRSPIVFSDYTRKRYLNTIRRTGIPIVDSAFPQYPSPYQNKN
jgi:hypothetical protein